MPSLTSYSVGDLVRVPFPHVELRRLTVRPALVIAIHDGAPVGPLLWVLMITNAIRAAWPGDIVIPDAPSRGLLIPCKVRSAKIATVMAADALKLGVIDQATLNEVKRTIARP